MHRKARCAALAAFALTVVPAHAAAAAPTAFSNSLAPNRSGDVFENGADSPDPWMLHFRGRYYLTTSPHDDIRFRGDTRIAIRSATQIGGLASAKPVQVWPPRGRVNPIDRCCQIWAPEFHRLRGPQGVRWYLYYTATRGSDPDTHRIYVAEGSGPTPLGPYRYRGKLELGRWAIDQTLVRLDSGLYVFYSGHRAGVAREQQLYVARLSNPWTVDGRSPEISAASFDWERTRRPVMEAPEALVRNGRLHLVYSASSCLGDNYKLGRMTVAAGADLLDPATWANAKAPDPVFQTSIRNGVFGPGHNGFFESPDGKEDWIVYHATDKPGVGCFTGGIRITRAQRVRWASDGTPSFGVPLPLTRDLRAPSGDRTLTRQLEDARLTGGSRGGLERLAGSDLVGGAGLRLRGRGSWTFAVRVPAGGRYRVLARLREGPRGARFRFRLPGAGAAGKRHDAYAAKRGYPELDLGVFRLPQGRNGMRFELIGKSGRSRGLELDLDQLRFVRSAAPKRPISGM
jgi:GH43 family beta-xylosidase